MSGFSKQAVTYLTHHTVLPPKLPQSDDACASSDSTLLKATISFLQAFQCILQRQEPNAAEHVGAVAAMIENLSYSRGSDGNVSETQLAKLLHDLVRTSSTMIPLEIKAQNAALLISREANDVVFEAFELAPPNNQAMSTKGRLVRSFPSVACRVPVDRLSEQGLIEAWARAIAKMSSQVAPGFQPQVRKAGRGHDEYRDTTHPGMITDYLMTVVAAVGTGMDVVSQGLRKNTREEVLWSNASQPWRRSPLWLLVRVAMQLHFTRLATNSLYKPFMTFFFSQLLRLAKGHHGALGSEVLHVISAKLTQRIRKLDPFFKTRPSYQNWMSAVTTSLTKAHGSMENAWKAIANDNTSNLNDTLLHTLKPSDDLDIKLEDLDCFIANIAGRDRQSYACDFRPTVEYPHYTPESIPGVVRRDPEYMLFQLAAAEKWVEIHLASWLERSLEQESTCEKILRFVKSYHPIASTAYRDLPSSLSIMYLCILELWVASDKSACRIHPLLRDFDPELQLESLQALSLPHKTHLLRLAEIETYVRLRRTRANSQSPSVMRNFGHPRSFAVRFFDQSSTHQALRSQIENQAATERQQKCRELSEKQELYQKLMKEYDEGECEYRDVVIDHYHGYTESQHAPNCQRCRKPTEAANIGINVHEWPLSPIDRTAKATVFELQVPISFGHWRDIANYVMKDVLGFVQVVSDHPRARYALSDHRDLSTLCSAPSTQRIILLSQIKPHTGTHRKLKSGVALLTESDVCLASGLQYQYFDNREEVFANALRATDRISKQCTYTLPSRSSQLQVYVQPGAPSLPPNQVIATLDLCPAHISVDEYKAFGTLPIGHSVQYMNILTQLAMPTIDFAKAETHCLILQTIHQAGPRSSANSMERNSHRILSDDSFGLALIKELEVALRRVTENWETWRALAVFVQLAVKLLSLSLNEEIQSRCLRYLGSSRQICLDWLTVLNHRLQTATDDDQRTELSSRVTEIALLCTTTFDVDEAYVNSVLSTPSAVFGLIQCSIIVQEHEKATRPEHAFLYRVMLQSWRSTLYRIFPKLQAKILRGNADSDLNKAVKSSWSIFSATERWTKLNDPWSHWIQTKCGTLPVHFNLLTAELLVKGLPLSRLPKKYVQHRMYESLFGKSSIEVTPTEELGMDVAAKHVYQGYHLFFGMIGPDMLVVAENEEEKLDLVPPHFFETRLPTAFVTDYIHWYNRHTKEVEFRPKLDPWLPTKVRWRLKTNDSTWRLVNKHDTLVNSNSNTATILSKVFAPLEKSAHVHITFDNSTRSVFIHMPRVQLTFYLEDSDHLIRSKEYRGMVVDSDQRIGTLVGLSNKLVLVNSQNASERSALVPEGTVSFQTTSNHVTVRIDHNTSVKVHAYAIDGLLGRITDSGGLQGRLYLAYLHALTSHCLPDQLTGQTGTEAALVILRSKGIASFGVFTGDNIAILHRIAELSAGRVYYPQNLQDMQQITWESGLPFLSQGSGFFLAVENIFEQARAMKLFYSETEYIEPASRTDIRQILLERDLIRCSTFYVDGFGAENFSTGSDRVYQGRTKSNDSNRGERAFVAASLILRNNNAIHSPVIASQLKSVLASDLLNKSSVRGPKSALKPSTFGFDARWLQKPTAFLPSMWCDLHLSLATARGTYNQFDVMMWLSTAAFAESAVMDVIQLLAAFYKCSEFDSIHIPSFTEISLAKGDAASLADTKSHIHHVKSFESSPEHRITKEPTETIKAWQKRRKNAFERSQSDAIDKFARALLIQWPCEQPTKPLIAKMETYLNTGKAMASITHRYKELHDNRRFGIYLQQVCDLMGRRLTLRVSVPPLKAVKLEKCAKSYHKHRAFIMQDIFSLQAPTSQSITSPTSESITSSPLHISTATAQDTSRGQLCLPQVPEEVDLPLQKRTTDEEAHGARDRLTVLCDTLGSRATSTCERKYVLDLQESCDSHSDQQSKASRCSVVVNSHTARRLEEYLANCEQYFKELNLLLENVVKASGEVGTFIHQAPRLCASFWLQQLSNDRFNTLSEAWKDVIVQYGLAVTRIHRAHRLLGLSSHAQDLAEEFQNSGHQNWDPAVYPETLLLEAESGIIVREVQEEIANQMRSPPNGSNAVMQLNMGEGKSSVIVPIVAAALANKKT